MSQEKLALECGLTRNYVSLLENGQMSPSLRSVFKLCVTLGVSPTDLISDVLRQMRADE
jgi:transcriptional regulator with XRE-family HTH domain